MNTSLPIYPYMEQIVNLVKNNDVTIISAETGSGKSTQVCQALNENGFNVVVTEPRRLAARSLAMRVADEMQVTLGTKVGFRTAFERNDSKATEILFCTDGLQLVRELQSMRDEGYVQKEHVLIIDECHEWTQGIEGLVAVTKKMKEEGISIKTVIMSATLETEKLKEWFGENTAMISVPGKLYHVEFNQKLTYKPLDDAKEMVVKKVKEGKNLLFFLPGKSEIYNMILDLKESLYSSGVQDVVLLPLHSELSPEEQQKCFETYDVPKVVISTNLAQTSVTVPDINVVIDTGTEKRKEVIDGIEGLYLRSISQADSKQRMGRAGRTSDGEYYLFNKIPFEEMPSYSVPEIQRLMLEQIVLRLLNVGLDAAEIEFFHQPPKEAIQDAKLLLERLGAIENNKVTDIGHRMSDMPISARFSRMIIAAEELGVANDVITVAAILEVGTLLYYKFGRYHPFTSENKSDLLAELDVWNLFSSKLRETDFENLSLNKKAFYRVRELREKLFASLDGKIQFGSTGDKEQIKRACLMGMLDRIFVGSYGSYYDEKGTGFSIDKKSCVKNSKPKFVFANPRVQETKAYLDSLTLLSMVTEVTEETLMEVVPQLFEEREDHVSYSEKHDCTVVQYGTYFRGVRISYRIENVIDHPDYERVKKEYEQNMAGISALTSLNPVFSWRSTSYSQPERQKYLSVLGIPREISYDYFGNRAPEISLRENEIMELDVNKLCLDDGTVVRIRVGWTSRSSQNVAELRNFIEAERISAGWKNAKAKAENFSSNKASEIVSWADFLGKQEVAKKNSGESVYAYAYLTFEKGSFKVRLSEDEETATAETAEATKLLFGRDLKPKLSDKNFMIIGHDGKKILTKKGQRALEEFKQYVDLSLETVTLENYSESIEEINEIYEELMASLKTA